MNCGAFGLIGDIANQITAPHLRFGTRCGRSGLTRIVAGMFQPLLLQQINVERRRRETAATHARRVLHLLRRGRS
jgi:hypothetical protein